MINIAAEYTENHLLRFIHHKTVCHIMGQNPFTTIPRWGTLMESYLILNISSPIGSILGENRDKEHCENRCRAARRSFYGLHGAGIKSPGDVGLKQHYIC